jgi:quercetin dioxygenase-like cupin family protein
MTGEGAAARRETLMSSLDRQVDGHGLVFDLAHEEAQLQALPADKHGRTARTLLKSGPLRITLIALAPGGSLPEHSAAGPITVQPLRGRLRLTLEGATHDLGPGTVMSIGARVRHAVESEGGASFLLTVAMPDAGVGAGHE